jgi:hypothetical protein
MPIRPGHAGIAPFVSAVILAIRHILGIIWIMLEDWNRSDTVPTGVKTVDHWALAVTS